jgi:hypothetical protein
MSQITISRGAKFLKQALIVMTLATAGLLLFHFVPAFAQAGTAAGEAPAFIQEKTGGVGNLRTLVLTMVNFFLLFLGLLAVLMIIYGGILYITAAGEQSKIDKGKKIIMYAIIGIIIILLSWALVNTILGGAGTGTEPA